MFDFNNNSTGKITSSQRHTMPQSMDKFQRFEAWLKENGARFDVVSDQLLRVGFVLYYLHYGEFTIAIAIAIAFGILQ